MLSKTLIRTIVFDFGNVIGFFDHRRATERLATHAGVPVAEVYEHLMGGTLEVDYESGRLSTAEFLRNLRARWNIRWSDDELGCAFADIFWPNRELCDLVPDLKARFRLVLGSNTSELHSRHFRRHFADTLAHFDHLVLSHEVGVRKPAAAFFEHCLSAAGCTPQQCLFVDDLPDNVAAAEACGWHGIVYKDFNDFRRRLSAACGFARTTP